MADIITNKNDHELFDNYIAVVLGLSVTVEGLQDIVMDSLDKIHMDITKTCSVYPPCNINCSRKYGNNFSLWCKSCEAWKTEILLLKGNPKHFVNWKEINSMDWDRSKEEIGRVFLKEKTINRYGIFQDLGCILSLFRNCSKFNLDRQVQDDVSKTRNEFFAHNYGLKIHTIDKERCIESLIAILKVPEIQTTKSAILAIPKLTRLVKAKGITVEIAKMATELNHIMIGQIENKYSNENQSKNDELDLIMFRTRLKTRGRRQSHKETILRCLRTLSNASVYIWFFICLLYGFSSKEKERETYELGCININYQDDCGKSLNDFHLYMEQVHNETFIGREWLSNLIQEKLLISERGVQIIADPGYGKTSMISKLVCDGPSSAWFNIRKTIMFYHLCRFDRSNSRSPSKFIKNLAGALMKSFTFVENFRHTDELFEQYWYGSYQCSEDPIGCFHHLIERPLKLYTNDIPNKRYTFVVDALDECEDTDAKFDILDILAMYIETSPKSFSFILTSRNIENIVNRFRDQNISSITLNKYEENINEDVLLYIQKRNLSLSWRPTLVDIKNIFNGNFLYAKYFLDYCSTVINCTLLEVPSSLADTFELNLKRVFGKDAETFEKVRPLFEVLAASTKPITETTLIKISNVDNRKGNIYNLIGNKLRHFVRITPENTISFIHKAFIDFLTDYSRRHSLFYIQNDLGHKRFADFLLKETNVSGNVDIVELGHHVALSKNPDNEYLFLEYASNSTTRNISYLHDTANRFNCYDTMELMIKLVGTSYVDTQNVDERSASFLAAEKGHEKSLEALLEYGADINFKVQCRKESTYLRCIDERNIEENMKNICLCEFTLLDVAAKNGRTSVVKLLLSKQISLLYQTNYVNLTALQLAAENNHLSVMNEIIFYDETLADTHALYLSSLYGHYDSVKLLLRYGAVDTCFACNRVDDKQCESQYIGLHDTCSCNMTSYKYFKYTKLWSHGERLQRCDTALQAAVRGVKIWHTQIVFLLLNQQDNSLNCINCKWVTPLMTAAVYNRYIIFRFMYEHRNLSKNALAIFNESEPNNMVRDSCPRKLSVFHILALYNNVDITKYLLSKGVTNWLQYDENQASTIHYAVCKQSADFIHLIEPKVNFSTALLEKTVDGLTPYQYAVKCGSPFIPVTIEGKQHRVKDEYDLEGRSILQLAIMHTHYSNTEASEKHLKMAVTLNHDLLHQDNNGNNFLHYVAFTHNYVLMKKCWNYIPFSILRRLLFQRNKQNKSVFLAAVEAISGYTPNSEDRVIKRQMKDLVQTSFSLEGIIYHQAEISTFIYCLELHHNVSIEISHKDIILSISNFVHKTQILPLIHISKIFLMGSLDEKDIDEYLTSFQDYPAMLQFFLPANVSEYCKYAKKSNGILHTIVKNYRGKFWKYFENQTEWKNYFSPYSPHVLDNCFNREGYNLLQMAVMGGNINLVKYFIDKGMNILVNRRENLVGVAIRNFPTISSSGIMHSNSFRLPVDFMLSGEWRMEDDKMFRQYHYGYCTDFGETLKVITDRIKDSLNLIRMKAFMSKRRLCLDGKQFFGLMHISAAKGFTDFLNWVITLHGKDIMHCRSTHQVTPLYLAWMFNQVNVLELFKSLNITVVYPSMEIQKVVSINYITNFAKTIPVDWTCNLKYAISRSVIIRRQMNKCAEQVNKFKSCV